MEQIPATQQLLQKMSYGVYIITTMDGNTPTGCIANSAMQITSKPSTVAVSINHKNHTYDCLVKNGRFALHILSVKSDVSLIGRFGF